MTTRQKAAQAAQAVDSWDPALKALALAATVAFGSISAATGAVTLYHNVTIAPLASRVDRAEGQQMQAQRDRGDFLQAIGVMQGSLRRIEAKLDRQK